MSSSKQDRMRILQVEWILQMFAVVCTDNDSEQHVAACGVRDLPHDRCAGARYTREPGTEDQA